MEYLKDSTQYKSFCYVTIVLTMFHGQAGVEHRFSLNKIVIVENMSEERLTQQRFCKRLYEMYGVQTSQHVSY